MKKILGLISLCLMLAGCAHGQVVVSDYCEVSGLFKPSRRDTPETLRQIAAANTKYRTLCPVAQ